MLGQPLRNRLAAAAEAQKVALAAEIAAVEAGAVGFSIVSRRSLELQVEAGVRLPVRVLRVQHRDARPPGPQVADCTLFAQLAERYPDELEETDSEERSLGNDLEGMALLKSFVALQCCSQELSRSARGHPEGGGSPPNPKGLGSGSPQDTAGWSKGREGGGASHGCVLASRVG